MALSLSEAADKWQNRTSNRAQKWKNQVQGKRSEFAEGLANFAGVNPGAITVDDEWADGVNRVSAGGFRNSVEGKAQKWQENFRAGITGGRE